MNQAILWLFLFHPMFENNTNTVKTYEKKLNSDVEISSCTKKRRNINGYQQTIYKVCA
jgi:hypothetical protein